jgi:hypothetical protein
MVIVSGEKSKIVYKTGILHRDLRTRTAMPESKSSWRTNLAMLSTRRTAVAWIKREWGPELRADAWAGCSLARLDLRPKALKAALDVCRNTPRCPLQTGLPEYRRYAWDISSAAGSQAHFESELSFKEGRKQERKKEEAKATDSPPWPRRGDAKSNKNAAKPPLSERTGGWAIYRLFGGLNQPPRLRRLPWLREFD